MKFCADCGHAVEHRTPPGDHLPRYVCPSCGTIHYQNPKIVAGCVPEYEGRLLLCRRAIEPRYGFWTIPAGFMENGETTQQAAQRESLEEACAEVEVGSLLAIVHVLHADQVHVMFRARLPVPQAYPKSCNPTRESHLSPRADRCGRFSLAPAGRRPRSQTLAQRVGSPTPRRVRWPATPRAW